MPWPTLRNATARAAINAAPPSAMVLRPSGDVTDTPAASSSLLPWGLALGGVSLLWMVVFDQTRDSRAKSAAARATSARETLPSFNDPGDGRDGKIKGSSTRGQGRAAVEDVFDGPESRKFTYQVWWRNEQRTEDGGHGDPLPFAGPKFRGITRDEAARTARELPLPSLPTRGSRWTGWELLVPELGRGTAAWRDFEPSGPGRQPPGKVHLTRPPHSGKPTTP